MVVRSQARARRFTGSTPLPVPASSLHLAAPLRSSSIRLVSLPHRRSRHFATVPWQSGLRSCEWLRATSRRSARRWLTSRVARRDCRAPRIEGELARTAAQLRLFAEVVADGGFIEPRIDPAIEDRKPSRRPDIRQRHVGLGPVAVFGASNFPLAFSVAGGDTASALAAGCPVIVKAHTAHPGTSELVGRAIQRAVRECGLHEGVFSLLFGAGNVVGERSRGRFARQSRVASPGPAQGGSHCWPLRRTDLNRSRSMRR